MGKSIACGNKNYLGGLVGRMAGALAALLLLGCAAAPASAGEGATSPPHAGMPGAFAGAWSVEWCEEPTLGQACGGFRVYLSQTGSRLCGTYSGADARQNRLDEGEPRSVIGTVAGSTAVLAITSERNHGVYLAVARPNGGGLAWEIAETIREGDNGEPALIADRDQLTPSHSQEDLNYLKTVAKDCQGRLP